MGLFVNEYGQTGVARWVRKGPSFCRVIRFHLDIDNHIAPLIGIAFQAQAQLTSDDTVCTICRQNKPAVERVIPPGGFNIQCYTILVLPDVSDLVLSAHFNQIVLVGLVDQVLLYVLLLQVVHGVVSFRFRVRHAQSVNQLILTNGYSG